MPPHSKRRKTSAVAEVVFDPAARQEYLTGFHKRKQARIKHAQEIAVKREKEEKRQEREELRKQREKNLEEHVKAVNESMRYMNGLDVGGSDADVEAGEEGEEGDEQWSGIKDENGKHEDDEYVDEDQYATVTVEAVDITKDGFVTHGDSDEEEEEAEDKREKEDGEEIKSVDKAGSSSSKNKKRPWSKEKPGDGKAKRKKSRNFKYESKEERKLNRTRDRAKRKSHAIARKAKK